MAAFTYEVTGPAAANGWQISAPSERIATATEAWHLVARIVQRSDPELAMRLRTRTAPGTIDHDGTRYTVTRVA
jgi:uncharacterized protein YhdP